jgi:hypothetical protein
MTQLSPAAPLLLAEEPTTSEATASEPAAQPAPAERRALDAQTAGSDNANEAIPEPVDAPISARHAAPQARAVIAPPLQVEESDEESAAQAGVVEQLLRAPQAFLRATEETDLVPLTRTLLLTVAVGAGVFGAVVGAFRGGIQVAYAALKVPLLLVGTLAICMPSFVALVRALGVQIKAREVVAVALGACARFALVLAGLSPVVWLLEGWLGYHGVALVVAAACGAAGLSAAALLMRGLARRGGGALVGLAFIAVFGVVGAQTSWLLRPFLVRPRTTQVPFLRSIEGDLLDSVHRSGRSAAGIYEEHDP